MKRIKLARRLYMLALVLFIIQNTYFGWNMFPESNYEAITDSIIQITFILATILYLTPLFKIYINHLEQLDDDKS